MLTLAELAQRPAPWLVGDAAERDIVLSSRVRLARNVQGHRFTHVMSEDELRSLRGEILGAAQELPDLLLSSQWSMEELEELERRFLLERHLVSSDLVHHPIGRAVLVSDDEAEGMMINEEDHLRVQAFSPGLSPDAALNRALDLTSALERRLHFATNSKLGYVTSCPTNVGTGMRASILLHLPGLVLTKDIERVLKSLRVLNYTVRGFYGEGSGVMGGLFQISNTATLGMPEASLVGELLHHVRKVISVEREARGALLAREPRRIEDQCWRALGVLTHARLLSTQEAFQFLGDVRLGTSLRIISGLDESVLNTLLMSIQGAHQQIAAGRTMEASERDEARARFVRGILRTSIQDDAEPTEGKDQE